MKTTIPMLNRRLLACSLAVASSVSAALADITVFNDTFEPSCGTNATRFDDPCDTGDIIWRPRLGGQASAYSVVNDNGGSGLGSYALKFKFNGNGAWVLGQFDNDASDGITTNSSAIPASLGGDVGDYLNLTLRMRMDATLGSTGRKFFCGLVNIPGGPLAADPGSVNTWINTCTGYYFNLNEGVSAQVPIGKNLGDGSNTPGAGGTESVILTSGNGQTVSFATDTTGHAIEIRLTRVSATSVKVDVYWDGTLVNTATDDGTAGSMPVFTQFNTVAMMTGTGNGTLGYYFDDVKLTSSSGYSAPVAVNDVYTVNKNSTLTVAAAAGVLANDRAYNSLPLTAIKLSEPTNGTLLSFSSSDGSFVYQPNAGYFGGDSFTYKVNDGTSDSGIATVALSVVGNVTWTGAADASWANPANWTGGGVPTGQYAWYDQTSTAHLTQTLDQNWSISGLVISNVGSPVMIAGNGFTLTNKDGINMANAGADVTILADYVSSGSASIAANRTLTLSNVVGGSLNGASGPGTLRLVGRAVPGQMVDSTGSLTFIVDGGSIVSNPPVRLNAEAGGTVRLIVTNNGLVQVTGNGTRLHVGYNANTGTPGNNLFNLESGTVIVGASANTTPNGVAVPNAGNCAGTLNLNGGLLVLTNKYSTNTSAAGESTLQIPANADGTGVVNLNGGTLIVPAITAVTPLDSGSGTLNFNGTVVTANRPNTSWIANLQNANVLAGGAIFDTGTNDVTIVQSLQAGSPSGGLTKLGSGTLRLAGYNSYTGPTIVGSGTLAVAAGASAANSSLVASNGATLNLDVTGGTTVLMPAATFKGATLNLNYGTLYGNPGSAAINNNSYSGLSLSATGVNIINISGTGFTAGDVPLIDYSGSIGGSGFGAFQLGTMPLGLSGVLSNDTFNSVIVLHLNRVPNQLTWYGDKSANWDTTTANWNGGSMSYTEVGGLGDMVTFDGSLEPTAFHTNVSLSGTLHPISVCFNNYSPNDYRLSGPGKLSGPGTLSKDGMAALTLATANDFTGGSFLSNGVVYLANDAGLGAGPVTMVGVTLSSDGATGRTVTNAVTFLKPQYSMAYGVFGDGVNTGSITLSGPVSWNGAAGILAVNNNLIFSGTLSNGGLDTKTGPGTLTFQGATDLSTAGNLQVEDGSMVVSSGTLTRSHGGIRVMEYGSATGQASFVVNNGASVLLDGSGVNLRLGYYTADPNGLNVVDIAGTVSCTTNAPSGTVQIGTNSALAQLNLRATGLLRVNSFTVTGPNSEVDLYGGTLAGTVNQSAYMQGLGACYVRSGGVTVNTVGLNGEALSLTIGQALLDGGSGGGLTKTGVGTLSLTGANTYTGTTTVNAGTLQLGGNIVPQSGLIAVADGATLAFAPATNSTVTVGAVSVGSSTGAVVTVTAPGTGNPSTTLASVTSLTLKGTVPVNVLGSGMVTGTIPLIKYTSLLGGGAVTTGSLPYGITATVTNDTNAKLISLDITRVGAAPPTNGVVIFSETFEINCETNTTATRFDDSCDPGDIIWRPRVQGQIPALSVVNDSIMGSFALKFHYNTPNNSSLFILGQFDHDASDGITTGASSLPASLGENVNDFLNLTMRVRVDQVSGTNGNSFKCGLTYLPGGPRSSDPDTGTTWINPAVGYYFGLNEAIAAAVPIGKQLGNASVQPYGGAAVAQLTNGMGAVTAAFMQDTTPHVLGLKLTRVVAGASGAVKVDAYWDGALVSTATDDGTAGSLAPISQYNTVMVQIGSGGGQSGPGYYFDDVTLTGSTNAVVRKPTLSASVSGNNLVLNATGGSANTPVWLLQGTNANQPMNTWTKIYSNVLDSSGSLCVTNNINPAVSQQFYRLQMP